MPMTNRLYKLMNWPQIEEIIYSESNNPHDVLGPHKLKGEILVQMYYPGAKKVALVMDGTRETYQMEQADEDGFFAVLLPEKKLPHYHYVIKTDERSFKWEDSYRFAPLITQKDIDKFSSGIHYSIYDKLGAHRVAIDGVMGTYFALWAPNAMRVSVVGDFNAWDGRISQMRRLGNSGIFEIFVPAANKGDKYKFEIKLKNGFTYLKADPYANACTLRPETDSVIVDLYGFVWEDGVFCKKRALCQVNSTPMSVLEVNLNSFMTSKLNGSFHTYAELARELIAYVKEMGYTHVQLMPVAEYFHDESLGYRTIGYYAPTARFGSPEDFMAFVNALHKEGIGVIMDLAVGEFPRDLHGLSDFDGTHLYEKSLPDGKIPDSWETLPFAFDIPQVSNYMIANLLFWVEKYHLDGIRISDTGSLLYLDYHKNDGAWAPNFYGGNENLAGIEFLKHVNSMMKKRNPGVLMIADGAVLYPKMTESLKDGGLGFDLKWCNSYTSDLLQYMEYDPYFRAHHHDELTLSMTYAYCERFLLPISHDERWSLFERMPGDEKEKIAGVRLALSYTFCHPGKKLLFMGQDFAEPVAWDGNRCLEWNLLGKDSHLGIKKMMADLNHLYTTEKSLFELEHAPGGFSWINAIASKDCFVTFLRKGNKKEDFVVVAANFSGIAREMSIGVPVLGNYKEIFNSDAENYGGSGLVNPRAKRAKEKRCDEKPHSISLKLAALSLSILKYQPLKK